MFEFFSGILANRKASLLAGGGIEDHVHLLVKSKPQVSLADLVRDVKANSSR
ncbi:MAG: hypothetical protein GX444_14695 [Myxococcales bacterium]|nr:hypothetical protein [Myxococcales bacterium]